MAKVLLYADTETGEILDSEGKPSGLSVQKLHGTTDVWVNGVWVRTAMLSAARPDIAALAAKVPERQKIPLWKCCDIERALGFNECLDAIGAKK